MDLEPNADEVQIIDAARDFFSRALPVGRLHRADHGCYAADIGKAIADLGWFGMGLPEDAGGFGFTEVGEMLVFREIGRFLGPVAVLNVTLASRIAAAARLSNLADLVSGGVPIALAIERVGSREHLLIEAQGAELAVLLDGTEAQLVDLDRVARTPVSCLDKSVSLARADLSSASVVAASPGPRIVRTGRLMTSAMLVGIAEEVTDMVSEYAKVRETFGRPIGAYQAVRHPIADMAVRSFAARCQLFLAAVAVRDGQEDADLQVHAAKVMANEAALRNVEHNVQLHGGIATTDEHDAHLYVKRANLLVRLFGNRVVLDRLLTPALAA